MFVRLRALRVLGGEAFLQWTHDRTNDRALVSALCLAQRHSGAKAHFSLRLCASVCISTITCGQSDLMFGRQVRTA